MERSGLPGCYSRASARLIMFVWSFCSLFFTFLCSACVLCVILTLSPRIACLRICCVQRARAASSFASTSTLPDLPLIRCVMLLSDMTSLAAGSWRAMACGRPRLR
eukprot:1910478-Rhodomonas_salina.2